jgi:hypothetical protein
LCEVIHNYSNTGCLCLSTRAELRTLSSVRSFKSTLLLLAVCVSMFSDAVSM